MLYLLTLVTILGSSPGACGNDSGTARPTETTATTSTEGQVTTVPVKIPVYSYRVVRAYPHDPRAFTQGLVFNDGILYESTGGSRWSPALLGQSTLRKVELQTGKILDSKLLSPDLFGEGITVFEDRIIQLTWKARVGFVYDKSSLMRIKQFTYSTEGWGITHDGSRLIMSDGTETLYFWDPKTLEEIGRVAVKANGAPVDWLNELEYIDGEIFANIWRTERIARISPDSGEVLAWVDLTGLLNPSDRDVTTDVMNGIAYDATGGRLFVTGKGWPKLFQIELIPPE